MNNQPYVKNKIVVIYALQNLPILKKDLISVKDVIELSVLNVEIEKLLLKYLFLFLLRLLVV